MIKSHWSSLLLAILLLLISTATIMYVSVLDQEVLLANNVSLIIVLFGLSLTTFAALTLILREIAIRLRRESIYTAREQALAEHRRFLRRLDHELKNPITALRAGLGSLQLTASPSQQGTVQTLDSEVGRLSHLVSDLRKLAELDVETLEVHTIVLAEFVQEIVALDEDRIQTHERQFIVEESIQRDRIVRFLGDQNLLLLAVHNLLDNALKYTQPEDTITLQIRVEDDVLIIRVQDTGSGIASDELQMVWEELYRGKTAQSVPGYGIGLALVRSIVEHHDGEVSIDSDLNYGTTVTMRLPLHELSR